MPFTIEDEWSEPATYDTMLEAMEDRRVFNIKRRDDGRFDVVECCDSCFGLTVTREQLLALTREIAVIANADNNGA